MKSLLVLSLLVIGAKALIPETTCYTDPNLNGYYLHFDNYAPNLKEYDFDNAISSVHQNGMWLYYENIDYNMVAGKVYFVHGIQITVNFPYEYRHVTSSLRYVGSNEYFNGDTITFYEGSSFTAREYYTIGDAPHLWSLAGKVSSLIVTGHSPWTIYSAENYYGNSLCVYPNTDEDTGSNGEVLNLGIYPNLSSLGINDNSINSVRKGCWSKKMVKASHLKVDGRLKNGAWGRLA